MRTVISFAAGFTIALLLAANATENATTQHNVQVIERTIIDQVRTTIDLDRIRDTRAASDVDDRLNAECAHAIRRHTDEPLAGIVIYVERYWSGDSCAALEHYHLHGWY
jgi:malate synthase